MTKDIKIECSCGCGYTLYVCIIDEEVIIGSEKDAKKDFEHFKGVIVDKKELIKFLKQ